MKPYTERRTSEIYTDILGRIVSGDFSRGQRLIEGDLAKLYKVSRTPIREVLVALENDGLVERSINKGAKVIGFSPDDVEQIYEIRRVLECLALRNSTSSLPLSRLLDLERRLVVLNQHSDPESNRKQAELDVELHHLIINHARNRRLIGYLDKISLLIDSLRSLGYRDDRHVQRVGEEHLAIVRALLRRDTVGAENLLAEHLDTSKRNALELFLGLCRSEGDTSETMSACAPKDETLPLKACNQ